MLGRLTKALLVTVVVLVICLGPVGCANVKIEARRPGPGGGGLAWLRGAATAAQPAPGPAAESLDG